MFPTTRPPRASPDPIDGGKRSTPNPVEWLLPDGDQFSIPDVGRAVDGGR